MAKGITVPVVQSGLEASIEAAAKKAGPLSLSATVDPSSFKRLAQPLGRVSGLATEFEKSIAASNARVIAFGASVGIINGVQNAFASLVKTTIEVEKSLTNIAVISGKTTDELQPFSRALFEIAKNTAQSFQTASEAALEFSRQGLGLEETLKRTQDALTLTRFTTLSAAEAVDVLTAAANSFGATGITTSEILNKLVAVDTKFAVSAEDLAKGLSRAGSIAQEVGVNFDELNAIVTIAQERTARGGAVIGNAFKTIFTRIRSDETIQALQSIGIYSFDAEGRLKPVVGLLEELAGKINTLGETKRIEVLEAIASKYNINVLTALVDDLGSTASKFREARDVSAGAQSEAYQRQIELNQTLDAVITRVTNSAAQLADTLGRIGVTDSLKSLLNFFDNILTGINDVIDSEGIGGTIAKGLISGLSGVFFKIGIPLLLAIFVKLTRDIAQFGVESLKTILGINKEVRERQALEQAVVNTLIKDQQVMASILSLSGDRRKQEEYLLSVYNRQLAALQQVQTIAAGVAPALQAAGLSATSGTVKRRAAEGYLPAAEAKDVRRGVGGASPSSKVVEIPNFSFGGGKRGTMVANTSEYIVPNYAGGSGTAIFNQDMAKEYGLPPGAKKITASGGFVPASGFVPNFAEGQPKNIKAIRQGKQFEENLNLKLFGEKSYAANDVLDFPKPEGFGADVETKKQLGISSQSEYGDAKRTQSRKSEKSLLDKYLRTPEGSQEFLTAKETAKGFINLNPEGLSMLFLEEGQDAKKTAYLGTKESILSEKTKDLIKKKFGDTKASKTISMPYIADKINKTSVFEKKASIGYIPNFAEDEEDEDTGKKPKKVKKIDRKKYFGSRAIVSAEGVAGMLVPDQANQQTMTDYLRKNPWGFQTKEDVYLNDADKSLITNVRYNTYGLKEGAFEGERLKKSGSQTLIEADVEKVGVEIAKKWAAKYSDEYAKKMPGAPAKANFDSEFIGRSFLASEGAVSAISTLGGGIFESSIRAALDTQVGQRIEKAKKEDANNRLDFPVNPFIKQLFGIEGGEQFVDAKISGNPGSTGRKLADQIVAAGLYKPVKTIKTAAAEGYIPNFASQNAIDAMRRIISDPAAPQGEKDAAASKLAQLTKVTSSRNPRTATQKTVKTKLPISEEDKAYLNQNKEKIVAGMGRSFGMLFNLDALELGDLNYVRRLDPVIAKKLSEIIQKQGGRDSIRSLIDFGSAARGYIPNFADNEPLKEALNREVAAGVPPARVRVTQDKRLKNPKNPNGLAVINTRDEPNGKIPNDFRERGMRAAMASRGFVPNFAEGVSLKGGTKFTTETQDIMGGAPISAPFPKEELTKLRKVLNEAVAAYEAEIKAGKDLEEAKKKLNEATNKATREANLSKESASKVQSAVAKTAGTITPEKKNDSKGIDIGKFLVLQTALAGATSALQAFTEENSNAARAIEGVNAGLSGLATFAALATSVNLPLRIFLGSLTALASAAPLLSRFFESQKDPAQKASEALEKLAKQAERTGQQLTPETLLAAIREQRQAAQVKEETTTVAKEVRQALQTRGIEATDKNIGSLTSFLLASGGVTRKEGKVTGIKQDVLGPLLGESGVVKQETRNIATEFEDFQYQVNVLSEKDLIDNIENALEERGRKEKNRVANVTNLQELDEKQRRNLEEQNAIEDARQRVLESLFNTQLKINADYNKSLIQSNNIVAALERQKGLLTESEYITAKANQEREKANAEFEKARLLVIEDLKKQLGAGEKDSPLGEQAQKFFENLDPKILQNLVDAFEATGGNVTASNQAYQDFIAAVQKSTGATGAFVNGMLQNLNQLGSKGAGEIRDIIRSGSQSQRTARSARDNAVAQSDSAAANELASTELRKLQQSTAETIAILQGTSGIIAKTGVPFNGLKKYTELLGIEQEKYKKSIVDLKLKNQLEIDSAEDKIEAEIEGTELRNQHSALMRKILGVDRAAEMAASSLVEETSKRVFELAAQSKNAGLKLNTDIEILDAETNLINAYNEVYKGSIQEDDARSKLANALAKSERSEQEKDTELKVQIGLIRKSWETEGKDIERKIELAEKRAILIKDIDYSKRAELELRSEALNLAEARRKAAANLEKNNLDLSVRNKIISNETRNLEEIKNIITEGRALTTAGVQSSFEQQARAAVVERRLAGRKNIDLRESTNILTGRDNSIQQNLEIQKGVLLDQAETFQQIIGNQTPKLFADGMAEAMQAALNQADDLGGALRNVALNFLKSLQSAFLQSASRQIVASILPTGAAKGGYVKGYATGGLVTGGSGYKDDVPAMLSEGEYVIRKSSVKKYGASNLQKLNSGEAPKFAAGGIFLPGIRGQTEISGYKDLTTFAKQTTTSGATDVLAGGATTAFANLEDQSSRLSAYALMREDDTINQEIRSAQEQAMNIMAEREAYRTAERKAFQKQLVGTVASAALSYGINAGIGKLGSLFNSAAPVPKEMSNLINDSGFDYSNFGNIGYQAAGKTVDQGLSFGNFADGAAGVLKSIPSYQAPRTQSIYSNTRTRMLGSKGYPFMAYGGAVKRYNAGGPTDDIPALLMGGEYVMNRQATKKYGKQFFDSINQGRAPRFADGGQVSTAEPSFAEKAATSSDSKAAGATNVSININVTGGTSDTQTQGDTKQGGIDYKKMSEQIKQVVIQTINEEKRLGGSLRSR